ncbi:MAG TPA: hypothetical protein DCS15_06175 [Flavobacteriales bacterium]|nr:hypothetical protein [Flavobacteriales bacterium]
MFRNSLIVLLSSFLLQSCIPDDVAVLPYDRGDLNTVDLEMGERFDKMTFYSLKDAEIVQECSLTAFDFYLGDSIVRFNPSRLMRSAIARSASFDEVQDTLGLDFSYEQSDGFGEPALLADGEIRIIDMGYDEEGLHLEPYKIRLSKKDSDTYVLEYALLREGVSKESEVEAGSYFSIVEGEEIQLPKAEEYDLLFTRYNFYFEEEVTNYLVVGVLISDILNLEVNDVPFEEIDLTLVEERRSLLSAARDEIGYDWKDYDFDTGEYTLIPNKNFIIEDADGFVYKFRFTSYYNESGESGHPSFEFRLL